MKLEDMKMAALLSLHNGIADKPAGPKTFATRSKMIDRIRQIATVKGIALDKFRQPKTAKTPQRQTKPCTTAVESADAAPGKAGKYGGVGKFTRRLLLDPKKLPYATIAERVNAAIPGAVTTVKTVRWYANKMRREGVDVPMRRGMSKEHAASGSKAAAR